MGRLNRSLCDTRGAAQTRAAEYTRTLRAAGFEPGRASPYKFVHRTHDLATNVHGDDFTATGPAEDLAWLEAVFKRRYGIKVSALEGREHQAPEVDTLGRTLRWTDGGGEVCGRRPASLDHHRRNLYVQPCTGEYPIRAERAGGVYRDGGTTGSRGANALWVLVARLNYLDTGRPDIHFAVKEAAKRSAGAA